eukprot:TRINITY_DN1544_c0_g1_i1.p1 TRINITY_DN1544_c0_g1~~TRINITY_DN1544_c0_g1_i1.p1  ORF type:complete len:273 (-),score=34.10 TRINITY_DN1544_c0_g1_i1:178-888(-)
MAALSTAASVSLSLTRGVSPLASTKTQGTVALTSSFVSGSFPSLRKSFASSSRSAARASTATGGAMGANASAATFAGKTFHDFSVKDIDGKDVSLDKFKGKVCLVVNVASACGLTDSNYKGLQELYEKYSSRGFEVLAFPSNQFGAQEPGSNDKIKEFACSRYKATFPMFAKVDVNGPSAAPVYEFLRSQKGGGLLGDSIKWNFGKFLVDKEGKVVERYAPTTAPSAIAADVEKLL